MARTKQATPRRDPSSEYISKGDTTGIEIGTPSRKAQNGSANGSANGHVVENVLKEIMPAPRKEAGALQLILAAGGIYGSL